MIKSSRHNIGSVNNKLPVTRVRHFLILPSKCSASLQQLTWLSSSNWWFMRNCPEEIANVLLISGSQDKLSWRNFILAKTLHCENFWAFTGPRIEPDFANIKHDYTQEFYRSYSSFISLCPRTGKFRGVCNWYTLIWLTSHADLNWTEQSGLTSWT